MRWLLRLFRTAAGDLGPDPRPALALFDVESFGLAHEIAELAVAVGANVKIGKQIGKLRADLPERHPSILALDLRNGLFQHRNGSAPGPQRAWRGRRIGARGHRDRQKILGIDESAAGLPKTLGR